MLSRACTDTPECCPGMALGQVQHTLWVYILSATRHLHVIATLVTCVVGIHAAGLLMADCMSQQGRIQNNRVWQLFLGSNKAGILDVARPMVPQCCPKQDSHHFFELEPKKTMTDIAEQ